MVTIQPLFCSLLVGNMRLDMANSLRLSLKYLLWQEQLIPVLTELLITELTEQLINELTGLSTQLIALVAALATWQ